MTVEPEPPAECLPKEWCPLRAELLIRNSDLETELWKAQTVAREILAKHRQILDEFVPADRVEEFTYVVPLQAAPWLYGSGPT